MVSSVSSNSLASAWANQIFSKLDTSNQGYIDKSALQSAFDKMSASDGTTTSSTTTSSTSSTSNSNVDQLFSSLDSNKDGKVTKDELTSALQNLADQLNSAFDQMRMGRGHHHHSSGSANTANTADTSTNGASAAGAAVGMPPGPPPGPPPGSGDGDGDSDDSGFTKSQLTQQLSSLSDTDSQRSSFLSNIVNNFDKADSNGDGKVSRQEAMAFTQSQQTSSVASTSSGSGSGSSGSSTSSGNSEANVIQQLIKLMQSYGAIAQDGGSASASSTFSISA